MPEIGPRPQLVRDVVFAAEEQRHRRDVRPGLSGLAQGRGDNAISWEDKSVADLEHIEHVIFIFDVDIVLQTVGKSVKREVITKRNSCICSRCTECMSVLEEKAASDVRLMLTLPVVLSMSVLIFLIEVAVYLRITR